MKKAKVFQSSIKNTINCNLGLLHKLHHKQIHNTGSKALFASSANYAASATVDQESGLLKKILKKAGFGPNSKNVIYQVYLI